MPQRLSARSTVCVLWLVNSAIGARGAICEDLPGRFAVMTRWHDPSADFFRGAGTALSPGLPMMAAQAVFAALSTRGGRTGKVGAAGLAALGAGATIGVLGEPITYRVLPPGTFDPAKAPIVSAGIVLSALMTVLGARHLPTCPEERSLGESSTIPEEHPCDLAFVALFTQPRRRFSSHYNLWRLSGAE